MAGILELAFIVAVVGLLWNVFNKKSKLPLPPGPKPLPLIGNIHQTPTTNPWQKYREWHNIYGPIISLQYGQRTLISLGSHDAVRELLDKRSKIYSSRPRLIIAGECVAGGLHTSMLPYGTQWRTHHRIQSSFLKQNWANHYRLIQDLETKQMLYDLLSDNNFHSVFQRFTSSIISTMAYGKRFESPDDHCIKETTFLTRKLLKDITSSQSVLVELFPVLNRLPLWMTPWKKRGHTTHRRTVKLFSQNLEEGRASASWNWVQSVLESKEARGLSPDELSYVIGILFEAGSDTTTGVLEVFVLACLTFPESMLRAQEELELVVGSKRLPSFEDLQRLPFTCAVATECLRWRPLTPLGFPHSVTEEDEYMGYRIPKDAMIIPNHWTLDLDEGVFEAATEFRPERWLQNPDLPPPSAFGFGRRACVGRYVAQNSLYISISRLLWAFNISAPYRDSQKIEVDPWNMQQSVTCPPAPFEASFKLRSPERLEIIEQKWIEAEKDPEAIMKHIHSLATKKAE